MILTGSEILKLISENNLVENYSHISQVQPAGFDVTLASIKTIHAETQMPLHFSNAKSIWQHDFEEVEIDQGPIYAMKPYVFKTNEKFNMPINVSAFVLPRSSLTRMGIVFSGGLVDAGYMGDLSFSVLSPLPIQFKKGQKFAQVVFFKHDSTFKYTGQYQAPEAI